VPLSISALWALIVRLEHCIRRYCPSPQVHEDVMLAVIEALSNAFGSAQGLAQGLAAGQRITVRLRLSPRQVAIDVMDPGGGFAQDAGPRPLVHPEREGGRGLYLIEQVMDEVSWSSAGNRIHMVRHWQPAA
jgi:anti-sigma regulatory factor (Ser/Thr protein kinase)